MYHYYGTRQLVSKLVKEDPEKAGDILTRCCEDSKVLEEINAYLLQPRPAQRESPALLQGGLDITFGSPPSPSVHSSHHTGSPLPRQRLARRPSSNPTTYPLSPPRSASSVTSHSTRNETSTAQYILLLLLGGNEVQEQLVRMKLAQIKHSVIRGDVVQTRGLDAMCTLIQPEVNDVYVPRRAATGFDLIPASCSLELTWRRPRSDSTHNTIFYVVPQEALDTDILLGYEDSGEGRPDYPPTIVPHLQSRQPSGFQAHKQEIIPHASTPPSASFHRSAMTYDGSARASPAHDQDDQYHPNHLVESFISHQQLYATKMGVHQPSPGPTVLGSQIQHPQPLRPNNAPTSHVRDSEPSKTVNRIRLSLIWDVTTLNIWLDLNAHGETFYEAFQQQTVKQRKNILDRATITIQLKKDKNVPDHEAYALSLDEDDLEADWETTLLWLEANKRDKSPHIFGVVELDEG